MHHRLRHHWLALTGPDAQRYLQGQVTADVSALEAGGWQRACLCDHKGALQAVLGIRRGPGGEGFWLDFPAELAGVVPTRLDRYLIADQAELKLLEPAPVLVHLVAGDNEPPLPELDGLAEALGDCLQGAPVPALRYARNGYDLAVNPESLDEALELLAGLGHPAGQPAALDDLRIRHAIPAWGAELVPGILPPEAGLGLPTLSLTKGCYLGQEVLSRIKSVGRARQLLARLEVEGDGRLEPGWTLHAEAEPGSRAVGLLATVGSEGRQALGRLKCKLADERGLGGRVFAAPSDATEKALFTPVTIAHSVEPFAR